MAQEPTFSATAAAMNWFSDTVIGRHPAATFFTTREASMDGVLAHVLILEQLGCFVCTRFTSYSVVSIS
jgi:hypothetical protein